MNRKIIKTRLYETKLRDQLNYMNNQKLYRLQLSEKKLVQKLRSFSKPFQLPKIYKPQNLDLSSYIKPTSPPKSFKFSRFHRNTQPLTERNKISAQNHTERSYNDQSKFTISRMFDSKQEVSIQNTESSKLQPFQITVNSQRIAMKKIPQQQLQPSLSRKELPQKSLSVKKPQKFIFKEFTPREIKLPSARLFRKAVKISGNSNPAISQRTLEIISNENQYLLQDVLNQSTIEDSLYRHGNYNRIQKIVRKKELENKKQFKIMRRAFAKKDFTSKVKEL